MLFRIMVFDNRVEAGQKLAEKLKNYQDRNTVVYGLPRGGVVIGAQIAKALNCPLEVIVARKIGHPLQPEFGIAAVTENGHLVENEKYTATVDENWYSLEIERQITTAQHRRTLYQSGLPKKVPHPPLAILTDDGVATGLTTQAALIDLKQRKPEKLILAVPVIPKEITGELAGMVDEIITFPLEEEFLGAVGAYYQNFPQVSDDEVVSYLKQANMEFQ
jgi:predicted phosphoribosyltransferase